MMSERVALKVAIDLMHVPSQVRLFRSEPLPDDVLILLRIAAGDEEIEQTAVALTGRSLEIVRQAAMFFIEQILFAPDADSYRVLGTAPEASPGELRRNVALLLRWLHPDRDPQGERSIFIGRVTAAWNNLKTPDRRAAYDDLRQHANKRSKSRSKAGKSRTGRSPRNLLANGGPHRGRLVNNPRLMRSDGKVGFFRRALAALFHRTLQ
jgi:DnaJ domain